MDPKEEMENTGENKEVAGLLTEMKHDKKYEKGI